MNTELKRLADQLAARYLIYSFVLAMAMFGLKLLFHDQKGYLLYVSPSIFMVVFVARSAFNEGLKAGKTRGDSVDGRGA